MYDVDPGGADQLFLALSPKYREKYALELIERTIQTVARQQARINKAMEVLDQNPGVLSSLIRDILSVDMD